MGRTRKTQTSNSLVASAARMGRRSKDYLKYSQSGSGWQNQAWEFYNLIGEFRYACDWVGSMLSKAILYATVENQGTIERVPSGPAFNMVDALFGDSDGRAEMLRLIGIHFTVAGECNLIGWEEDGRDHWMIAATSEVKSSGGILRVDKQEIGPEDDVFNVRLWMPHPKKPTEAHAPSRAVLGILGEIYKLTQHVSAQVDSRLAGAGILLMPSEMNFPPPKTPEGQEPQARSANNAADLMEVIQEVMATAIEDRGDPSALVPIVITAPGEAIQHVKHMTFWSELDEQAIRLRDEAIRRLALGMDMPPEVLQGTADSNHWAAWQADESAIKGHTEPLLKVITSSLAEGYLRPLLEDDPDVSGIIEHYSIAADTSEMRLRPNRSKEALELYDRGVVSAEVLRRETGFSTGDGMEEKEMQQWFLRKVASGSTTPELVASALKALGVPVAAVENTDDETREARPDPSLLEHPVRDIPDREKSERRKAIRDGLPVLAAASEQMVLRALERAGNRLKSRLQLKSLTASAAELYLFTEVRPGDMDDLLADAWGNVGPVALRHGISPEALTGTLDSYCRLLMQEQSAHTYERLEQFLVPQMAEVSA